ncbi:hypothetical protein E4U47_006377 [Claviceps purpurea]|nr:hypothetical protein E4U10_001834 [Claviceps purpurea]KAG6277974.1 hypothetical protein E4U47_006377 [Claviceps purpurea]
MKFAKQLERDAVPEWRIKYLNYKAGKKRIQAVSRAINRTPKGYSNRTPSFFRTNQYDRTLDQPYSIPGPAPASSPKYGDESSVPRSEPIAVGSKANEAEALHSDGNDLQYGSFVPTPPAYSPLRDRSDDKKQDFALPAPAIEAPDSPQLARPTETMQRKENRIPLRRRSTEEFTPGTAASDREARGPFSPSSRQPNAKPTTTDSQSQLRRILSHTHSHTLGPKRRDTARLDSAGSDFDLIRERKREFFDFMDSELDKVEAFYKLKEDQAGERLSLLRQQLHEMRNRRIHELSHRQHAHADGGPCPEGDNPNDGVNGWVQPIKAKMFPPGPNSKALRNMATTPRLQSMASANVSAHDAARDYTRRRKKEDVSYRTAKRKLKMALQEFYRGLELLKSYALLNRTAFRKLNKKFDKAAHARPPLRYMNDRVNKAWFVQSDVLDGHIKAVEDVYARYFERGNHKLAAGKLRSLTQRPTTESSTSFLNGFLIGTGLIFNLEGLIYGAQLLETGDDVLRVQTSYLMQIYAGYFLMLLMLFLFCVNCFIWTRNKINYPFIFEFDQRSMLDWRRLAVFPSFFFLLLGIFMWMNFSRFGAGWLYIYYPVFLISITVGIIFVPGPYLCYKSRKWFIYAHWRLLLAGLYPVEFRDFFLGDMYCSLTYAMANIELFFCLYANHWNEPQQCNSSNSRLLGFFLTLPPIWRLFQCLRRYRDTRNVFPHLVNGGKYVMTIVAAVMLSLYRINHTTSNLALFIGFSVINSVYVSIWDLFMDFSLLQTDTRHRALRDILALKRQWPYYLIMTIDPILRFAWIFYAIFTHNTQHSALVSFFVSLVEILRRAMWALLRVENEHCANVAQYKASRDIPLPYLIEPLMGRASSSDSRSSAGPSPPPPPLLPPREEEEEEDQEANRRRGEVNPSAAEGSSSAVASALGGTVRRRTESASGRSFSKILAEAHKQDFVKRRMPGMSAGEQGGGIKEGSDEDEDEDEDEDYDDDDDDDDDDEVVAQAGRDAEAEAEADAASPWQAGRAREVQRRVEDCV